MPVAEVVAGIDAVVISHLHSDHFDDVARSALPKGLLVLCPLRIADKIRGFGFTNVQPVGTGTRLGEITMSATAGHHGPPEVRDDMGPVSGFVFRAPTEPRFYWAGDTILCDEVREVIAAERPEVIVVHACGAAWGGIGPIVMDAEMALETVRLSRPAIVIATHMDAVDHATVSRSALRAARDRDADAGDRLRIPEDGDRLDFNAPDVRSRTTAKPSQ
jgi:L-ascorbate metabolism protein UlaG (beta-lactamase superfamily)